MVTSLARPQESVRLGVARRKIRFPLVNTDGRSAQGAVTTRGILGTPLKIDNPARRAIVLSEPEPCTWNARIVRGGCMEWIRVISVDQLRPGASTREKILRSI